MATLTLTWMVTFLIKSVVFVVAGSIVAMVLVTKSAPSIIILMIFLFTCSIIGLVLCMSTLCTKAKTGVTAYTFLLILPGLAANYITSIAYPLRLLCSLWSPLSFVFTFQQMFLGDAYDKQGIQWSNINQPLGGPESGNFSVLFGILMLIVDTFLYMGLAMYFNRIVPGNGGRTKSCCYCLGSSDNNVIKPIHDTSNDDDYDDAHAKGNVEETVGGTVGVSIRKLSKIFKSVVGADVKAVDGFTLDMYDSQVTALLGKKNIKLFFDFH